MRIELLTVIGTGLVGAPMKNILKCTSQKMMHEYCLPSVCWCVLATFVGAGFPWSSVSGDEDPDAPYVLGPESQRQDGVPKGTVTKHVWQSQIFEGTTREYYIYVPAQYDGSQPARVMVFQDGHAYVAEDGVIRAPVVFDNLIHKGDLPVMVGIFVNPGHRGSEQPENRWRANNRSFEYDTLSDQYARFLAEELIPHVADEHQLNLSTDPDDRAICGASSGGICAFTAAWEHPEWFSKVLSHIGSFTNIRGGHVYPALIRKTPRKPIRVFLQDGDHDLDNEHGNWWLSNLQMEAALRYSRYDVQFVAGQGKHSPKHGGAILPDSLRWLWRDHVVGGRAVSNDQPAVNSVDVFEEATIEFTGGPFDAETISYRLLSPERVEEGQKYPLVVFLHGAGERGRDNQSQLKYFPAQMAQPRYRERFPCYVLAPQCREGLRWVEVDWTEKQSHQAPETPDVMLQAVMQMIDRTIAERAVDPDRIYLTGLSMGGFGVWDLATRQPDRFAAVAPVCGGADHDRLSLLTNVPAWVTHGGADTVVDVVRSRDAVTVLKEAGGRPVYVELPGVGHNSWTPAYADEDGLVPWLFRQVRR